MTISIVQVITSVQQFDLQISSKLLHIASPSYSLMLENWIISYFLLSRFILHLSNSQARTEQDFIIDNKHLLVWTILIVIIIVIKSYYWNQWLFMIASSV